MKPRELIATAMAPGGVELRLLRHDGDHVIALSDGNELMSSRLGGSEEALAVMSCERIGPRPAPRLLIGGYGMGFTLRAALAATGPDARITVAELVPEIIDWARGPMAAMTAGCLDDPRVQLFMGDVATEISVAANAKARRYDAIMLDVDNGASGLTQAANDRLYSRRGLAIAAAALKPGGVLAIWSAAPDVAFLRLLQQSGFADVDEVSVRARSNGKGPRHIIWFAKVR